ncbi:MAG: hypothetical protein IPK66_11880 [Rhodospirillales bacterium]|nr:hypothetical protein [Rhodospirillales bacterium]
MPPALRQQITQAVAAWSATGDATNLQASISDACVAYPEIARDIVAYAGETAAKSRPPEQCLGADAMCMPLGDILSALYDQAGRGGGETTVSSHPGPVNSGCKDNTCGTPCQQTGTCSGPPDPASDTAI